eukprot:TRINITY_DN605_c0_g2_i1.p1 TRINITY_DN605_c0_g2~~TRINITY_DN605_c0_g2_i1.p1  ORF type:complete len:608 (+),score=148.34 TRINITY_DN605_c0_g2_i1:25-1824(+)
MSTASTSVTSGSASALATVVTPTAQPEEKRTRDKYVFRGSKEELKDALDAPSTKYKFNEVKASEIRDGTISTRWKTTETNTQGKSFVGVTLYKNGTVKFDGPESSMFKTSFGSYLECHHNLLFCVVAERSEPDIPVRVSIPKLTPNIKDLIKLFADFAGDNGTYLDQLPRGNGSIALNVQYAGNKFTLTWYSNGTLLVQNSERNQSLVNAFYEAWLAKYPEHDPIPKLTPKIEDAKTNEQKAAEQQQKKLSKRSKLTDSGLHLLKGAIVNVLGASANLTTSVDFTSPCKAAITVVEVNEKPNEKIISAIQAKANEKIAENVAFHEFKLARKEAEERYKKNPVNSTFIYDKYPVPESIQELSLVEIADWNINCCNGTHVAKTGELKALYIYKSNYNAKKKQLELTFSVGDDAVTNLSGPKDQKTNNNNSNKKGGKEKDVKKEKVSATKEKKVISSSSSLSAGPAPSPSPSLSSLMQSPSPSLSIPSSQVPSSCSSLSSSSSSSSSSNSSSVSMASMFEPSLADKTTQAIMDDIFSALSKHTELKDQNNVYKQLRKELEFKISSHVRVFQNLTYTRGFTAHYDRKMNIQDLLDAAKMPKKA